MKRLLIFLYFLCGGMAYAQSKLIVNGIPWYDNNDNIVNAHGACIVEENGRYYLLESGNQIKAMHSQVLPVIHQVIWLTGSSKM